VPDITQIDGVRPKTLAPAGGRALRDAARDEDWIKLASYLDSHRLSLDAGTVPQRFTRGIGNRNYLLRLNDDWVVLRRPPAGPLPPGANDMTREHRLLSRLSNVFPLAPRSIHFCPDPSILGAPFLLMEYRPGMVISGAEWPAELASDAGQEVGPMLVRTLAAIHAIDPKEAGLEDIGKPEGFLRRAIDGWSARAAIATDNNPPPAVRDLISWLEKNLVPGGAPTLLHSDFKLDNVILDPTTLQPVAVIDWDMGTRGDPLLDLATLLSYWSEASDPPPLLDLGQMPSAGHGFPRREEIERQYGQLTGRDLRNLQFYRVLAQFKLGVVFLQQSVKPDHQRQRDLVENYRRTAIGLLDVALEISKGGLN